MTIQQLSEKQAQVFDFIVSEDYALICDGAVRSGKTTVMIAAFVIWAMEYFDRANFGICGKTVQSAERNVLKPLMQHDGLPYSMDYKVSTRILTVKCGPRVNWFYLFGGKDESSYMLIQGITLAGVFFDEVALMPKSFVDQALARAIACEKPKYFFNCNPESPNHYFYKEWIENPRKGTRHIHFLLEDNPIMTEQMITRTKAMYTGVFYERFIQGRWVVAQGLVYPFFADSPSKYLLHGDTTGIQGRFFISIDYGTHNPCSMGLWCVQAKRAVRIRESYFDSRAAGYQRTDEEHYQALVELARGYYVESVIVDPSAASFIETIRRHEKFRVLAANNDVLNGIQVTASLLKCGKLIIHDSCKDAIREFSTYCWDDKAQQDRVVKENDHAMDEIRYFAYTILAREFRWADWRE